MTNRKVYAVGVGHTPFTPAGKGKKEYSDLGSEAIIMALKDAGLEYGAVQEAVCGFVYGDSTSGQAACYKVGLTGIPVMNVNNNCATGSTCLYTAKRLVEGGASCVLAVGFEQMSAGLKVLFDDRTHPAQRHFDAMWAAGIPQKRFIKMLPEVTENILKVYAANAKEFMTEHNITVDQVAKVAYKNHAHSKYSPFAMNKKEIPLDKIKTARPLFPPLTTAMAAPMASGAAAAILVDEAFVRKHNLQANAVELVACAMTSDTAATFDPKAGTKNLCGYDLSARAANQAFREAGMAPRDIDVYEIHDAFASNELVTYEALGMAAKGEAGKLVDNGHWITNKAGGKLFRMGSWVVNPSGGLESKGHPTGATGLAQMVELNLQLRNQGGMRQVDGAQVGLQHNYGWASAAVVTIYRKAYPESHL